MGKKITASMSVSSLQDAAKEIENYKKDLLQKCNSFIKGILDRGYIVARNNATGTFGGYITIEKRFDNAVNGIKGILYATDSGDIVSQFKHGGEVISVNISPLLMCEFGSGLVAENPKGIAGVGTGTNSLFGHANEDGWYFIDIDNNLRYATGYKPHAPMYKALLKMESDIMEVAREVFR